VEVPGLRGDTPLAREPLPDRVRLEGSNYIVVGILKADTFAANYLLDRERDGTRHVLKISRFRWSRLPRIMVPLDVETDHEVAIYRRLATVEGVPPLTGRPGRFAFLHAYVPGRCIGPDVDLPPDFFDQLEDLVARVHARGVAYVDMEKEENILLGDDGRPHLIDFQISVAWPAWLRRRFQAEDLRHLLKHRARLARATLAEGELDRVWRRSLALNVHRMLTRPYFLLRRWMQGRLRT